MATDKDSTNLKLKPLIIYCCPESETYFPVEASHFPRFFDRPEIALSKSAELKGWARLLNFEYKTHVEANGESFLLKLNTFDIFIVYPLSLNTLAKFALGLQDSYPCKILQKAAQLGKPVLLNDQFLPEADSSMNPHLIRVYRQHWETITSGTIAGFNFDNLEQVTAKILRNKTSNNNSLLHDKNSREFITRDDILVAAESLGPLKVSAKAVITDLAKETAEELGVAIVTG
ncbi:MAG: flavoprotein [Candidatus Rifleibacteriota bacterium]